jgi:hypothetical protein
LPSSLTEGLPSTSVCSTSPPVSVCGTGAPPLARGFSRQCGLDPCGLGLRPPLSITPRVSGLADLPTSPPYRLGGFAPPDLAPCVPPSLSIETGRYGTSNPLSIAYDSRPRLRPDSPADDQHGCGTLGHSVGGILTPLALLVPTFALPAAPGRLPPPLHCRRGRSPTTRSARSPSIDGDARPASAASVPDLSPGGLSVPRHTRPVSYYALFQGMAASKPTSWLSARHDYLAHLAWISGP